MRWPGIGVDSNLRAPGNLTGADGDSQPKGICKRKGRESGGNASCCKGCDGSWELSPPRSTYSDNLLQLPLLPPRRLPPRCGAFYVPAYLADLTGRPASRNTSGRTAPAPRPDLPVPAGPRHLDSEGAGPAKEGTVEAEVAAGRSVEALAAAESRSILEEEER